MGARASPNEISRITVGKRKQNGSKADLNKTSNKVKVK